MYGYTRFFILIILLLLPLPILSGCMGTEKEVIMATTTSTVDSGLLDILKPEFEKSTGYILTIVSVGSGQAIAMAERGEVDALLVHSPKDEERIEEAGVVKNRQLVMHNDFVLIGPAGDPAGIKGMKTVEALKEISRRKALFISRGDSSGTHKKELGIWEKAGVKPAGEWYQETGTGMGQTINVAAEKDGYTLSDRATYLAQKENNRLQIIVEGDKALLNIYHVMQVNQAKFAKVNAGGGKAFVEFMVSPSAQKIIDGFGVDKYGQSLFIPDAGKNVEQLGE